MKPASLVAFIFIVLIAIAHLLRLLFHVQVTVGGAPVPMWFSIVALIVTGGLALMLWRENRRR